MLVALLSCTKEKLNKRCSVSEMYSNCKEFKAAYDYANLAADKVFVLSSKYGLLECDDEIDPVNENMAAKPPYEKRLWAANVIDKLSRQCNPEEDEFLIFAEKQYFEYLTGELRKTRFPLSGVADTLKHQTLMKLERDEREYTSAENAHRLFNQAREYTWDTIDEIPYSNGVYVIFEKNEQFMGFKRITRVGTHRGDGNLKSRLQTHFVREDKNWSILRKNIGRAILSQENDPYLKIWDMETGTPDARQHYADLIDEVKENAIEKRVSMFLQHHVTFACIEVESWFDRLRIEEGLISTLNLDPDFGPSRDWFGKFSPEYEIRNSGLWLKRGLDKIPLKRKDMELIEAEVKKQESAHNKTKLECIQEEVNKIIKFKLSAAREIDIRYLDIFSEDIMKEIKIDCTDKEILEAMKMAMRDRDEVMLKTNDKISTSSKVRYFL